MATLRGTHALRSPHGGNLGSETCVAIRMRLDDVLRSRTMTVKTDELYQRVFHHVRAVPWGMVYDELHNKPHLLVLPRSAQPLRYGLRYPSEVGPISLSDALSVRTAFALDKQISRRIALRACYIGNSRLYEPRTVIQRTLRSEMTALLLAQHGQRPRGVPFLLSWETERRVLRELQKHHGTLYQLLNADTPGWVEMLYRETERELTVKQQGCVPEALGRHIPQPFQLRGRIRPNLTPVLYPSHTSTGQSTDQILRGFDISGLKYRILHYLTHEMPSLRGGGRPLRFSSQIHLKHGTVINGQGFREKLQKRIRESATDKENRRLLASRDRLRGLLFHSNLPAGSPRSRALSTARIELVFRKPVGYILAPLRAQHVAADLTHAERLVGYLVSQPAHVTGIRDDAFVAVARSLYDRAGREQWRVWAIQDNWLSGARLRFSARHQEVPRVSRIFTGRALLRV